MRACAQAKQQKPYIESSHLFDDFISSCTIGGVGYFRNDSSQSYNKSKFSFSVKWENDE